MVLVYSAAACLLTTTIGLCLVLALYGYLGRPGAGGRQRYKDDESTPLLVREGPRRLSVGRRPLAPAAHACPLRTTADPCCLAPPPPSPGAQIGGINRDRR